MFIDNLVDVAKRELSWEVDYAREAECTKKFKNILERYPEYYVPTVYGTVNRYTINYDLQLIDKRHVIK